jgi:hypothetical protein
MSEAEDRYLAEIVADCEAVLGPGVEVLGVEHDRHDRSERLTVRYRLGDETGQSEGLGETVIAAHAALREQLVVDRLRLGFTVLADPR